VFFQALFFYGMRRLLLCGKMKSSISEKNKAPAVYSIVPQAAKEHYR
jgi:hypothetical protein